MTDPDSGTEPTKKRTKRLLTRLQKYEIFLQMVRQEATIVEAAGTPVVPFMAAAGVQSLEAPTRYLRFVPGIDPVEARRALRGQLRDCERR